MNCTLQGVLEVHGTCTRASTHICTHTCVHLCCDRIEFHDAVKNEVSLCTVTWKFFKTAYHVQIRQMSLYGNCLIPQIKHFQVCV
jgi:hypothetical protein